MKLNIDERRFLSIDQVQGQIKNVNVQKSDNKGQSIQTGANSFASILNKIQESSDNTISSEELKFSKHAANRLQDRNIVLTDEQMARLNMGKIEAGEKGIKDSLILIDQLAFIVNVPNNTVVTAMDQTENKSNVFTNIDGAVIA
nr:TIGR02530 family flagellar biosynthesis protein [Butyrivibrio sp. AE2015]